VPNPCSFDSDHAACVAERQDENPNEEIEQSNAVCYSMWRERDCGTEKHFSSPIEKDKRDGRWVLSASSPDRVGDTIDPKAYVKAASRISDRLPALFNHDSGKIVGFWDSIKAEGARMTGSLKLVLETGLGRYIKALLDAGVPISSSIGFRGLDAEPNKHGGLHFKDIEILETSLVATPAHPGAIQIAKSFGIDLPKLTEKQRLEILVKTKLILSKK